MTSWFIVLACGYFAATISGVAGFGGALLLLPVIALVTGDKLAVPILIVAQLLGTSLVAGSWTSRKLVDRLPERIFILLVEALLVISAIVIMGGKR
jgi:uncharacterized membrane protein YfcA